MPTETAFALSTRFAFQIITHIVRTRAPICRLPLKWSCRRQRHGRNRVEHGNRGIYIYMYVLHVQGDPFVFDAHFLGQF